MRFRTLAALALPLALLPPSPASAQAPDPGANAAMKYWQAFSVLPTLDKAQETLLDGWKTAPLDAPALSLIEGSRLSREYLHRGAKVPRCDWSLDYEDGILLRLPYLQQCLTLARLTALHARHEFEQGHNTAGWDDVIALLKVARDVEQTPIMIANLVGYRIESIAIEAATPYLPGLKSVLRDDAFASLDALPPGATLLQLVQKEKEVGPVWLIRKLKEAERTQSGSWRPFWKEILSVPDESGAQNRDFIESAKTFEQAIKMLEDLLPWNDQLASLVGLPWREFDAQYPEFARKAKAAIPLAGYLLPGLDRYVASQRRSQTQMAQFRAAVAVVRGGPGALKAIPDPYGDVPFEYRTVGKGFELKSKFLFKGQPVSLTVGTGRNE